MFLSALCSLFEAFIRFFDVSGEHVLGVDGDGDNGGDDDNAVVVDVVDVILLSISSFCPQPRWPSG